MKSQSSGFLFVHCCPQTNPGPWVSNTVTCVDDSSDQRLAFLFYLEVNKYAADFGENQNLKHVILQTTQGNEADGDYESFRLHFHVFVRTFLLTHMVNRRQTVQKKKTYM